MKPTYFTVEVIKAFLRWKTGRADVVIELNLLGQADQGNVVFESVWVPVRVGESFI